MDEEPASDDDRVFYMDPGFSVPDFSDLLELDTESARILPAGRTEIPTADCRMRERVKSFCSRN